jgi:transposase InsO family protein
MVKHTPPETRKQMVCAVRRTKNKSLVAWVFGVARKTVQTWCKRAHHRGSESFRDRRQETKKRKITEDVESAILAMRIAFEWGTGRLRQGLISLPDFAREAIEKLIGKKIPSVRLSRTAINDVLAKHGLNGYHKTSKAWKFFRAKKPDELWQLDLKGPFRVHGKKFWIVVCVDDYSRYLILCELFERCPATQDILCLLDRRIAETGRNPEKILTDNGGQFKESWEKSLRKQGIEPLFAHPYYPQDKGKVERTIRNISEEFVKLLKKFPQWLGRLSEYKAWYNLKRLHRGIMDYPARLYCIGV